MSRKPLPPQVLAALGLGRGLDRRRFMELLAASGVAVYTGGCAGDKNKTPPVGTDSGTDSGTTDSLPTDSDPTDSGTTDPKRVLVLGGGLAGLTAAYELMKAGYDVTVLEAQGRAGGRVKTERDAWGEGQVAEMGAARIPDVHDQTLAYVEEFGLELEPFSSGDALYVLKGNRFMHEEGGDWPLDMTAEENTNGLDMWSTYVAAWFDMFGNPRDGTFPASGILDTYDDMTWTDFLLSQGCSDDWLLLYTADNGTEISKIGCLAWMAAEVADQDWSDTYHVKGGNDQIPAKLAEALGDRVRLGRMVTRLEHSDAGVAVSVMGESGEEVYEADHCVCALPFSVLRNVTIEPAFAADKTQCIAELFMMNSARGYLQTRSRFWQEEGIGGLKIAKTDTLAERVWDLSNTQTGTSGLIMMYCQHENADALTALPEADREEYCMTQLETFFPEIREETTAFVQKSWGDDPYVKGAWCDILPGQGWMFTVVGRAEGRVHFAGEHTSIWAGWMQGAIESGKRAAAEIMAG